MILSVDFNNSEKDAILEKSIIQRIKETFTQGFIASINVLIKKDKHKTKSEIDLISHRGTILHIQTNGKNEKEAVDRALKTLESKITKLKNEKGQKRA